MAKIRFACVFRAGKEHAAINLIVDAKAMDYKIALEEEFA